MADIVILDFNDEVRALTEKDWKEQCIAGRARFCQLIECQRLLQANGVPLPDGRLFPLAAGTTTADIAAAKRRLVEIGGLL